MISKAVTVRNIKIHYLEFPAKNKPKLLLLHGFHGTSKNLETLSFYLSCAFHVIAPDLPGFGKSQEIKEGFSIKKAAFYLSDFISALGLKKYYLGGVSMGGSVVLEMVTLKTTDCQGLIFIQPFFSSTHLSLNQNFYILKAFLKLVKWNIIPGFVSKAVMKNPKFLLLFLKLFNFSRQTTAEDLKFRLKNIRTCTPKTYIHALDNIFHYQPARNITCDCKTVVCLNPADEVIDSQKTLSSCKEVFSRLVHLTMDIDNHNPEKKPTVDEIEKKFPHMEKIISFLLAQEVEKQAGDNR